MHLSIARKCIVNFWAGGNLEQLKTHIIQVEENMFGTNVKTFYHFYIIFFLSVQENGARDCVIDSEQSSPALMLPY